MKLDAEKVTNMILYTPIFHVIKKKSSFLKIQKVPEICVPNNNNDMGYKLTSCESRWAKLIISRDLLSLVLKLFMKLVN